MEILIECVFSEYDNSTIRFHIATKQNNRILILVTKEIIQGNCQESTDDIFILLCTMTYIYQKVYFGCALFDKFNRFEFQFNWTVTTNL